MSGGGDGYFVQRDGSYYLSANEQARRLASWHKATRECVAAALALAAATPPPKPGDADYVDWETIFNTPRCSACNGTGLVRVDPENPDAQAQARSK